MRYVRSSDVPNAASAPGMMPRAPAIRSHPGGLYMRKPYVSFTYKLPLTSSRTGGGAAGFAGDGAGAVGVAGVGDFAATTAGAFFGGGGAGELAGGVVEAALGSDEFAGCAVAAAVAGVVGHLLAGIAVGAAGGGAEAAGDAEVATGAETLAGALLAVAAGEGAAVVSFFTGFGGATVFSAAGSGFFSLPEFAGASDMMMVATWSLSTTA